MPIRNLIKIIERNKMSHVLILPEHYKFPLEMYCKILKQAWDMNQ